MNRAQRDLHLIIGACLLVCYGLFVAWWVKVLLCVVIIFLVINFPFLRLFVSMIGATKVSRQDVLMAMKVNVPQTALEIKREIERRKGLRFPRHVSLFEVQLAMFALTDQKLVESREREPRQPALNSPDGYLHEYRRIM